MGTKITGEVLRNCTVPGPVDEVYAALTPIDRLISLTKGTQSVERLDDTTVAYVLKSYGHAGKSFEPKFTVRYTHTGHTLSWTTVDGNLQNEATIEFLESGANTEIRFHQTLSLDLPFGGFVAKMLRPVAEKGLSTGLEAFYKDFIRR